MQGVNRCVNGQKCRFYRTRVPVTGTILPRLMLGNGLVVEIRPVLMRTS
jgi:hypothetical protein